MSMFDWYIPEPAVVCPHCGTVLNEWQGKEGPCALFVWQQGRKHPIDQRIDAEVRWAPEELTRFELPERIVIYKHAVRNAINPLVTVLGLALPGLVGGSIVTAIVLNIPTVGRAYFSALQRQDEPVIMGALLFFSLFLLIGNVIADFLLAWVDPRIRYD